MGEKASREPGHHAARSLKKNGWPWSAALATSLVVAVAAVSVVKYSGPSEHPDTAAPLQGGTSYLRFVHAAPGGGTADVAIDGEPVFSGQAYQAITDHAAVAMGKRSIEMRRATGQRQRYFAPYDLTLGDGERWTALLTDRQGTFYHMDFIDDLTPPPSGKARLRLVHASSDAGLLRLIPDGSGVALGPTGFRTVTSWTELPAGNWNLEVRSTTGNTLLLPAVPATLAGGTSYTAFLMGLRSGSSLQALTLLVHQEAALAPPTPAPSTSPSPTSSATVVASPTPIRPTATATASPTKSQPTPTPTASPTTAQPSATPTPTASPPVVQTPTATAHITPVSSPQPSSTAIPSATTSPTTSVPSPATATSSPLPSPSATATVEPTRTPSPGPTDTPDLSDTATPTNTPRPSPTATAYPTDEPIGPPTSEAPVPALVPRFRLPLEPAAVPATGAVHDVPRHRGIDIVSLRGPLPVWLDVGAPEGLPGGDDPWGATLLAPWAGDPATWSVDLSPLTGSTPPATAVSCPAPCGAWEMEGAAPSIVRSGVAGPFAAPDPRHVVQDNVLASHTGWSGPDEIGDRVGVYLGSGEAYVTTVDMVIEGRGFEWRLERRWRAGATHGGALGPGWTLAHERRLVEVTAANAAAVDPGLFPIAPGDVLRLDGYGRVDRYAAAPGGGWLAPAGYYTTLERLPNGGWRERDRRGVKADYGPSGAGGVARLVALSDRHGNTMQLHHDAAGRLVAVDDTLGRRVHFRWSGVGVAARLIAVVDPTGRRVEYRYDAAGRLTAVVGPEVRAAVGAAPSSIVRRYTYEAGPDDAGVHRLIGISAPAFGEAAPPRTRATLRMDDGGRLAEVELGGTVPGAPSAGGRLSFARRAPAGTEDQGGSRGSELLALGTSEVVIVTDRAGRLVEYGVDDRGRLLWRNLPREGTGDTTEPSRSTTTYAYTAGGELSSVLGPGGDQWTWHYDDANVEPRARGNVLAEEHEAAPSRAGSQKAVTTTWHYEPVWQRVVAVTPPRGNDPNSGPQVGEDNRPSAAPVKVAEASADRFTRERLLDYQEGNDVRGLALAIGVERVTMQDRLNAAGIVLEQGDINRDGRLVGISGDVVAVRFPTLAVSQTRRLLSLFPDGHMPVEEFYSWRQKGVLHWSRDPEHNLTVFEHFPEHDPAGNGGTPAEEGAPLVGLLAGVVRDAELTPPPPTITQTPEASDTPLPGVPLSSPTPDAPGSATAESTATIEGGPSTTPDPSATGDAVVPVTTEPPGSATVEPTPELGQRVYLPWTSYDAVFDVAELGTSGLGSESFVAASTTQLQPPVGSFQRNGGLGGPFEQSRTILARDALGRVVRIVDSRGVAHERRLDAHGRVIESTDAVDVELALARSSAPLWAACTQRYLPECTAMNAKHRGKRYERDADGLTVRREVDMVGEHQAFAAEARPGPVVISNRLRDALTMVVEESQTVSAASAPATTRLRYDRAGNLVLQFSPVASLSADDPRRQPANVRAWTFDALFNPLSDTRGGLPAGFAEHTGHDDLSETEMDGIRDAQSEPATTRFVWDGDGRLLERHEPGPAVGAGGHSPTMWFWDGFGRMRSSVDPVGAQTLYEHDADGRVVRWSLWGPSNGPSPANNAAATLDQPLTRERMTQPLLRDTLLNYDELGRLTERHEWLAVPQGVTTTHDIVLRDGPLAIPQDGWVTTIWELDRKGRLRYVTTDDGAVTEWRHDGLDRTVTAIDAENGETHWHWDGRWPLRVTHRWRPRPRDVVLGQMPDFDLEFTTTFVHDAVGRPVRATDGRGNAVRWGWDSLDRLVTIHDARHHEDRSARAADPLGLLAMQPAVSPGGDPLPPALLNRPGNTTRLSWDGLNRRIGEQRDLHENGMADRPIMLNNPANLDGRVTVDYVWDANSRLVAAVDDGSTPGDDNDTPGRVEEGQPRGNPTRFAWDALDRRVSTIRADGTQTAYGWNASGELVNLVDPNGTTLERHVDGAGRLIELSVSPGRSNAPHPAGGTRRGEGAWSIAGMTTARYEWDGTGKLTAAVAEATGGPSASRVDVTLAWDSLGRLMEERRGAIALAHERSGRGARLALIAPDGTRLRISTDRLGRLEAIEDPATPATQRPLMVNAWLGPLVAERITADGSRRTILEPDLPADHLQQSYEGLDPVGRVIGLVARQPQAQTSLFESRLEWDADHNLLQRLQGPDGSQGHAFSHDSLGRRVSKTSRQGNTETTTTLDGVGNRTRQADEDWRADVTNAYVAIDGQSRAHDDIGQPVDDGRLRYQWDFAGRLVSVERATDGQKLGTMAYDALGRPAERTRRGPGGIEERLAIIHDGLRLSEEHDAAGRVGVRYLPGGTSADPATAFEVAAVEIDTDGDGGLDERWLAHHGPRGEFAALTALRVHFEDEERIETSELIDTVSYDPWGSPVGAQGPGGLPARIAGLVQEPASGLFGDPTGRLYDPTLGRWLQPDIRGSWADPRALGNPYVYHGHTPRPAHPFVGIRWPRTVVPDDPRAEAVRPPFRFDDFHFGPPQPWEVLLPVATPAASQVWD